jgi:TonB family protein
MLWLLLLQAAGAPVLGPTPIGDPSRWVTFDHYPPDALAQHAQGTVAFDMVIDESGRAARCDVLRSAGHRSLDRSACTAIRTNGRWRPEQDHQGKGVYAVLRRQVAWHLPAGQRGPADTWTLWKSDAEVIVSRLPVPPEQALVGIRVLQRADGTHESCTVIQASALPALDRLACSSAASLIKPELIRDASGEAVRGVRWRKIQFVAKPTSN